MVLQSVKMASAHYFLDGDEYVLKEDATGLEIDRMKEVTLLMLKMSGELLAHGRASAVSEFQFNYIEELVQNGKDIKSLCYNMMLPSGKIPVDILNKCLDIEGYAVRLFCGEER